MKSGHLGPTVGVCAGPGSSSAALDRFLAPSSGRQNRRELAKAPKTRLVYRSIKGQNHVQMNAKAILPEPRSVQKASFYQYAAMNGRRVDLGGRFLSSKANSSFWLAFIIISAGALMGRAQQAVDDFNPNADGIVRVTTVQPDGKILVGGIFTSVAPNGGPSVPRNRIARFNPDGTLDTAFNPNANSDVFAITVQPDGRILVGGYFTTIGGTNRNRIARLDPVTGAADGFDPGASDLVRTIVV